MNGEEVEYWYEDGRLLYEKRGTDKEFYYSYDGYGNLSCIRYFLNGAQYTYYFLTNAKGDVELIYGGSGVVLARYYYDSWGNTISIKDGDGEEITDPTNIALLNPIRYRGYYYDSETELYYLQSRYYDPTTCRFVNADLSSLSAVSPGTPQYYKNLYAYCDNNPVMRKDDGGQIWIATCLIGALIGVAVEYVWDV
ncbi:MAG: RHS repeat-associated core domain-containing protein, partial [Clostridia bacterium]|nr:RHS repeat-associated core domain-containing protein [Clostridia bacterium]